MFYLFYIFLYRNTSSKIECYNSSIIYLLEYFWTRNLFFKKFPHYFSLQITENLKWVKMSAYDNAFFKGEKNANIYTECFGFKCTATTSMCMHYIWIQAHKLHVTHECILKSICAQTKNVLTIFCIIWCHLRYSKWK